MRRCAFLTQESLDGYVCDDDLAAAALGEEGWQVDSVPWKQFSTNWDQYDVVVIRSTWDYHRTSQLFLNTLRTIDSSRAQLVNALPLVLWNLEKTYLKALDRGGFPTVPTLWGQGLQTSDLDRFFSTLQAPEIVLKPVLGANAEDTFRLRRGMASVELMDCFQERAFMVQPFCRSVLDPGEYSLIFFGEQYSHSIIKSPRSGDFRVQEEHGGRIEPVDPPSEALELGRALIAWLDPRPLYARIDLILSGAGDFLIGEVELIEPSLYFRMDAGAPARFVRAFVELSW